MPGKAVMGPVKKAVVAPAWALLSIPGPIISREEGYIKKVLAMEEPRRWHE